LQRQNGRQLDTFYYEKIFEAYIIKIKQILQILRKFFIVILLQQEKKSLKIDIFIYFLAISSTGTKIDSLNGKDKQFKEEIYGKIL